MWDMCETLSNIAAPVVRVLAHLAGNAPLLYGDDTTAAIFGLTSQIKVERSTDGTAWAQGGTDDGGIGILQPGATARGAAHSAGVDDGTPGRTARPHSRDSAPWGETG